MCYADARPPRIFGRHKVAVPGKRSNVPCRFKVWPPQQYPFTPRTQFAPAYSSRRRSCPRSARPEVLAAPQMADRTTARQYGLAYLSPPSFSAHRVVLLVPDANELVLFYHANQFSATHGGGRILGLLFPRRLMRAISMSTASPAALSVALQSVSDEILLARSITGIGRPGRAMEGATGPDVFSNPAMKHLTLDLAPPSFLGADIGPEVERYPPAPLSYWWRPPFCRDTQALAGTAMRARHGPASARRYFAD